MTSTKPPTDAVPPVSSTHSPLLAQWAIDAWTLLGSLDQEGDADVTA